MDGFGSGVLGVVDAVLGSSAAGSCRRGAGFGGLSGLVSAELDVVVTGEWLPLAGFEEVPLGFGVAGWLAFDAWVLPADGEGS